MYLTTNRKNIGTVEDDAVQLDTSRGQGTVGAVPMS